MDEDKRSGGPDAGDLGGFDPAKLASLAGALGLGAAKGGAGGRAAALEKAEVEPADRTVIVELHGECRPAGPNTTAEECSVTLDASGLTIRSTGGRPIRAGYRDINLVAIQQETALLVMGEGSGEMRLILAKFGD